MRLLNTESLEFGEFFDSDIPSYTILSHRWGSDEVSYQEMSLSLRQDEAKLREGARKILQFCDLARQISHEWVWIDTCCIDKKSSAELTEAINSMWSWYQRARVCFVYLSDVWQTPGGEATEAFDKQFRESRWFTRGWTLQELLAPTSIAFYNADWEWIGSRKSLSSQISIATGISLFFLGHTDLVTSLPSIATRMSWAAKRETSRVEDRAYSLLGLFGVNMPLLYGEGQKAFLRLQIEILNKSDDESIFARHSDRISSGMLAEWPSSFAESGAVTTKGASWRQRRPYAMTNQGLKFQLPTIPIRTTGIRKQGELFLTLNCYNGDQSLLESTQDFPQKWISRVGPSSEGRVS